MIFSCNEARRCECYDKPTETKSTFYINGNKKDSKRACVNLADSTETCTLIDK